MNAIEKLGLVFIVVALTTSVTKEDGLISFVLMVVFAVGVIAFMFGGDK